MKKPILIFVLFAQLSFSSNCLADKQSTISNYKAQLISLGLDEAAAESKAESDVGNQLEFMEGGQADMDDAIKSLDIQVKSLASNDSRSDEAKKALETAKDAVKNFTDLKAQDHLEIQPSIGGSIPRVISSAAFLQSEDAASERINEVRRILIAPNRPGGVPTGDIVEDFLPQAIRQLYRFAWLAILISFIISGIMLVIAQDNEDRINKAKGMIYHTIIGFVFIALSFAIVKAVSDIDFFNFI